MKTAVIVIDIQGDFTEFKNGPLSVKGTDQAFINQVQTATRMLKSAGFPVFATQDWHPPNHISFYTNHQGKKAFEIITLRGKEQVLWPPHCIQETEGAKILLDEKLFDVIVRKGTQTEFDSYSGFKDDGGNQTPLHHLLQKRNISRLIVYGIATDYCVKATVLDAIELDYRVIVVADLSRGVSPETTNSALNEMQKRGAIVVNKSKLKDIF
ncbi:MAG: bifunctional nicotinamidase/pyrazinamidase [Deltaproteobacteria bacterium]|nr:MAG: bifunctional nicotinamidase/pyrazinamidase [Deltaproteobacteria bacterium]